MKRLSMVALHRRLPPVPNGRAILLVLLSAFYSGYGLQHVRLNGHPQPEFHGPPYFVPVDGNAIQYAINTSSTILRIGQEYFLYQDGGWFRSSSAQGQYTQTAEPALPASTTLLEK